MPLRSAPTRARPAPSRPVGGARVAMGARAAGRADAPRPGFWPENLSRAGGRGRRPGEPLLAQPCRRSRWWLRREVEVAQNLANDRPGGDGRDDAQGALLTARTALPVDGKDPLEQPGPPPARRDRAGRLWHALLTGGAGDDRPQLAVRRQTAAIPHLMHPRRRHQRGQLLQQLQGREFDPARAIGPRFGEGVDQITVSVLLEALQGHRTAGGIADQKRLRAVVPQAGLL